MNAGAITWLAAGPAAALAGLAPLIEAHRQLRPVRLLELPGAPPPPEWWRAHLDGVAAVMIAGDRRYAPRLALRGVLLHDASGRSIPAGWLPGGNREEVAVYARAAARVVRRAVAALSPGPLVMLAQWEDRALALCAELAAACASRGSLPVLRWSAERVMRHDLLAGLRYGLGAALYCGHGNGTGWLGYGGITAREIAAGGQAEPIGGIISLSCSIASRQRRRLSFAEELVTGGACAALLAATAPTLHVKNRALGHALCGAIADGAEHLGAAVLALPREALAHYRIIGDPMAPLVGTAEGLVHARALFAPAPDDPLGPLASRESDRASLHDGG